MLELSLSLSLSWSWSSSSSRDDEQQAAHGASPSDALQTDEFASALTN